MFLGISATQRPASNKTLSTLYYVRMTWTYDLYSDIDNFKRTVEGDRSLWDIVYLNDVTVIAVASVTARINTGVDVQKAKNGKRGRAINNGSMPVELTIKLEMQPGEWPIFVRDIVPMIRPSTKNGGQPRLKIKHPEAQAWGVNLIKVMDVDSPPPRSGGTKTVTIKAVEDANPTPVKRDDQVSKRKPFTPVPLPNAIVTDDTQASQK